MEGEDARLAQAMHDHPESYSYWERAGGPSMEEMMPIAGTSTNFYALPPHTKDRKSTWGIKAHATSPPISLALAADVG